MIITGLLLALDYLFLYTREQVKNLGKDKSVNEAKNKSKNYG